jgi:hypothetical protein
MVQLEFDFNEREKQTAVGWLTKIYLQTNKIDIFDLEVAKEMEEQRLRDAIMYALDEDGHTGDWKIKFVNDYINNLKQTK